MVEQLYEEKAEYSHLEYNKPFLSDRHSLDKVLNKQGRKLAETMSALELICLHGSSQDDSKGHFTFLNSWAGSVVDYIFCSPRLVFQETKYIRLIATTYPSVSPFS